MITTQEIIGLLVGHVADISASDLVKKCNDLGMQQVPYQDVGLDSNLPPFEAGYHFRFNLDGKEEVLFEILEKESLVLQAGYQLVFPASLFSSKAKKKHRQSEEVLETYYGVGLVMKVGRIKTTNYGNDTTVAYISRAKGAGIDVITLRVGNRRFWH
jgi:hypothetical protein